MRLLKLLKDFNLLILIKILEIVNIYYLTVFIILIEHLIFLLYKEISNTYYLIVHIHILIIRLILISFVNTF